MSGFSIAICQAVPSVFVPSAWTFPPSDTRPDFTPHSLKICITRFEVYPFAIPPRSIFIFSLSFILPLFSSNIILDESTSLSSLEISFFDGTLYFCVVKPHFTIRGYILISNAPFVVLFISSALETMFFVSVDSVPLPVSLSLYISLSCFSALSTVSSLFISSTALFTPFSAFLPYAVTVIYVSIANISLDTFLFSSLF